MPVCTIYQSTVVFEMHTVPPLVVDALLVVVGDGHVGVGRAVERGPRRLFKVVVDRLDLDVGKSVETTAAAGAAPKARAATAVSKAHAVDGDALFEAATHARPERAVAEVVRIVKVVDFGFNETAVEEVGELGAHGFGERVLILFFHAVSVPRDVQAGDGGQEEEDGGEDGTHDELVGMVGLMDWRPLEK